MKINERTSKGLLLPLTMGLAALVLVSSVEAADKGEDRVGRRAADISDSVRLEFPHAGFRAGATGLGSFNRNLFRPTEVRVNALIPPERAFSADLLTQANAYPIAWADVTNSSKLDISASLKPGPQVLKAANLAAGSASAGLTSDSLETVNWGGLEETTLDLQSLSEALVRGWFDMPGAALSASELTKWSLDRGEFKDRPWVVTRSYGVRGLEYQLKSDRNAKFNVEAGHATYGEAGAGLSWKRVNEQVIQIETPMSIAFDAAVLKKVDPPLPSLSPLQATQNPFGYGRFKFTWEYQAKKKTEEREVDVWTIMALAGRTKKQPGQIGHGSAGMPGTNAPAESSVPPGVLSNLVAKVESGKPAPLSLWAEAGLKQDLEAGRNWRILNEGESFSSDEALRVRVRLPEAAFLYVLAKDSLGGAVVLHPRVDGEAVSAGEDALKPAGDYYFPPSEDGSEAYTFDPAESPVTESFIVIASKTQPPGLAEEMRRFAASARQAVRKAETSQSLAFADLFRVPTGKTRVKVPGPGTGATAPAANAGSTVELPVYSGVNAATVRKLNLIRKPGVPPNPQ